MSTSEASEVRQRSGKLEEEKNPASLSNKSSKKVPQKKPAVSPPLSNVTMNKFLTYMVLGLVALSGFYVWRFTVWAAQAGGYWNLLSGRTIPPKSSVQDTASIASAAAQSSGAAKAKGRPASTGNKEEDIQSQIFHLANALGIKPAELSSAIRPLIDPSVPNPAEQAQHDLEMLKAQQAANGGDNSAEAPVEGGVLGVIGEAFLD